jgi:hypothetical protein
MAEFEPQSFVNTATVIAINYAMSNGRSRSFRSVEVE